MPARTAKPVRLSGDEKSSILTMSRAGASLTEMSKSLGRDHSTISRFLATMRDTSDVARAIIRAGSVTLAERIVKKATVSEAMDVLSRPGIDVLTPAVGKGGAGNGFNVQLSVAVASCGTVVKVEGGLNDLSAGAIEGKLAGTQDGGEPPRGILASVAELPRAER